MTAGYSYKTKSIADLQLWSANNRLNLEPAFQRRSVWSLTDRRKLIESILDQRPIPSIFLYRRSNQSGTAVYDVIDGKQRIETLMMFMGSGGGFTAAQRFDVKRLLDDGSTQAVDWGSLSAAEKTAFRNTELQVVEIDWGLSEVIDLFVRINSTGKSLTGAEKMNAKWVNNEVLLLAKKIAEERRQEMRRLGLQQEADLGRLHRRPHQATLQGRPHRLAERTVDVPRPQCRQGRALTRVATAPRLAGLLLALEKREVQSGREQRCVT